MDHHDFELYKMCFQTMFLTCLLRFSDVDRDETSDPPEAAEPQPAARQRSARERPRLMDGGLGWGFGGAKLVHNSKKTWFYDVL